MLVCLMLVAFFLTAHTQVSSGKSLRLLQEQWKIYTNECVQSFISTPAAKGVVCNRTFDQYVCWPDGSPGSLVNVSCPWYLPWFRKVEQGLVYRVCNADGHWSRSKNTSECEQEDPAHRQYGRILSTFKLMYTVGYSLSLAALTLALSVLLIFRKLHCMRNNIHMNLFGSFVLRAASILIKDALLDESIRAQSRSHQLWISPQTGAGCRVAVLMMQYSVMANNCWLLVEGLYLHSLLLVSVFSERNYFLLYICIGWGAPLMFVLPWAAVKHLYENEECWERNISMGFWWIIRSPILLANLINFFIFIRIIKILMLKLKAHQMRYTDYKFRLAKSTLTLIPLLGIHAVLFTFVIDESVEKESVLRLVRLFYDLLFSSFQGLLVAVLYCFVNKEVQSEMLKKWKRWKLGKDIEEEYRHTHSQTAQAKTASVALAMTREDPETPEAPSLDLSCKESQQLVTHFHNGLSRTRIRLQFSSDPQEGSSNCSSLTEDMCLDERPLDTERSGSLTETSV